MRLPDWWPGAALVLLITTMLALLIWALSGPDLCEQRRGEWVPIGVETYTVHEPGVCLVRGEYGCTLRSAGRDVERERTVYECRGGDQTAGTLVRRGG